MRKIARTQAGNLHLQWNQSKIFKRLYYLSLSLNGSLPFRHNTTPQGDILGLHSMSTSPPTFTSVWLFTWF